MMLFGRAAGGAGGGGGDRPGGMRKYGIYFLEHGKFLADFVLCSQPFFTSYALF